MIDRIGTEEFANCAMKSNCPILVIDVAEVFGVPVQANLTG